MAGAADDVESRSLQVFSQVKTVNMGGLLTVEKKVQWQRSAIAQQTRLSFIGRTLCGVEKIAAAKSASLASRSEQQRVSTRMTCLFIMDVVQSVD